MSEHSLVEGRKNFTLVKKLTVFLGWGGVELSGGMEHA